MTQNQPLPATANEARARGLRRYLPSEPCPEGHHAPRYLHGGCTVCLPLPTDSRGGARPGAGRPKGSISLLGKVQPVKVKPVRPVVDAGTLARALRRAAQGLLDAAEILDASR
jgi:hypothetical protein